MKTQRVIKHDGKKWVIWAGGVKMASSSFLKVMTDRFPDVPVDEESARGIVTTEATQESGEVGVRSPVNSQASVEGTVVNAGLA